MFKILIILWLLILITLLLAGALFLVTSLLPDRIKGLTLTTLNCRRTARKIAKILFWLLLAVMILSGIVTLTFSAQSYDVQKKLVDILAPDGDAEQFNSANFFILNFWIKIGGIGLIFLSAGLVLFRKQISSLTLRIWEYVRRFGSSLSQDHRAFWRSFAFLKNEKNYLLAVLTLFILGSLLRLYYLNQPVRSDEAHTFLVYTLGGLEKPLLDFNKPNNHIFHSILVLFSTRLFGDQPWMIRLPAFLAGILIIPATYLVCRVFYSREIALLSAGLVTVSSALVEYSANARGYSMIVWFTLILFGLAEYLRRHKNLFAWCLFVIIASLGFYTITIMLFPFGGIMAWLLLTWSVKNVSPDYEGHFVKYWICAGLGTFALTVFFYLPSLAGSGLSIAQSRAVTPVTMNVLGTDTINLLQQTWQHWNRDLPWMISLILIAGFCVHLVFHSRIAPNKIPVILAVLAWSAFVVFAMRRISINPRVWLYLLPWFLIWASAGIVWLWKFVFRQRPAISSVWVISVVILLVLMLGFGMLRTNSVYYSTQTGALLDADEISLYIKTILKPGDTVISLFPSDTILDYYFHTHQIPGDYLYRFGDPVNPGRVYMVVNKTHQQTVDQITEKLGITEVIDPASAVLLREYESAVVLEVSLITPVLPAK